MLRHSWMAALSVGVVLAGGSLLSSTAAEAQYYPGYRAKYRAPVARPYGYAPRYYGGPRYGYRRGWNPGAAAAAGVVGGLALGAIAASAAAAPAPVYDPYYAAPRVYAPAPVYVAPPANRCGYVWRQVFQPGWGWTNVKRYECDY